MKTSKIVDAVGYIDDDFIAASIDYKPRKIKIKWLPYAAAAVCAACLCIAAVRISAFDPQINNTGIAGNTNGESLITGCGSGDIPSGEKPTAYLSSKAVTFSTAKEQVKFADVKEITETDFVGYELEYAMPSETLVALRYVYTDGEVSVSDNSGDYGVIVISPEHYEKIERDGMVFWKSSVTDPPSAVYISESDVAYVGTFKSDADLSKAIDTIKSLI